MKNRLKNFLWLSLSLIVLTASLTLATGPSIVWAAAAPASGTDPAIECTSGNCDLIGKYVNPAINAFSIAFGLVAVISIILGSINYTMSEGDPQKSSRAKQRITNTIIAIVAYIFLYSFLQFLVPGGLFK